MANEDEWVVDMLCIYDWDRMGDDTYETLMEAITDIKDMIDDMDDYDWAEFRFRLPSTGEIIYGPAAKRLYDNP